MYLVLPPFEYSLVILVHKLIGFQCIFDRIFSWFNIFHFVNWEHLLCPITCQLIFKGFLLPYDRHLITNMEFRFCYLFHIYLRVERIVYVFIVCWLSCICRIQPDRSAICIIVFLYQWVGIVFTSLYCLL